MGLFGDLDVQQFDDNPWAIPDDKYEAVVTKSEVGETKAGDKVGWTLTYTIESGRCSGQSVTEWKRVPQRDKPMEDDHRAGSFLKERLLSLGIPENRLNEVTPDEILGRKVYITTRQRGENVNVQKVEVREAEGGLEASGL